MARVKDHSNLHKDGFHAFQARTLRLSEDSCAQQAGACGVPDPAPFGGQRFGHAPALMRRPNRKDDQMTNVIVMNQNTQEYWDNVRLHAKIRKADKYITDAAANVRSTMIYEQYVLTHLQIITRAAHRSGLINDPDQYKALKEKWAKHWGLEELITEDESAIAAYADEATYEAAGALYGQAN